MTDTSYNPGYAPYARWSVEQAPVPATTHNLPSTIAASGSVQSSLIVTEGFTLISAGVTSTQAGTMSIQRYLDAGGTVPQGSAVSVNLTASSAANLDVLDGKPFASFILTVTNSSGTTAATLSNFALLLQTSTSNSPNTGGANNSVSVTNFPATQAVSGTIGVQVSGAAVSATNPLAIYDGYQNPTTATWTSATALNTAFATTTSGYDTVILTLIPSGTITAGVATFEVYDGVNWLPIKASRIESYNTDGSYTLTGTTRAWQIPVAGFPQFRVRLSTAITGSGNVGLTLITSSAPDTSIVTVGVDPATVVAVSLTGNTATDGSTTITTGGTAQNLFGGTTPVNGYSICNPDSSNDLWVSDSTTAAANGAGSIRVAANGGYYATEPGQKPLGAVSVIGAVTGQKITARRW